MMEKYKIYQSNLIKDNHLLFVNDCSLLYEVIQKKLNTKDTTWNYHRYNTFILSAGSVLFFKLYKDLISQIKEFLPPEEDYAITCWLNYHVNDSQLKTSLGLNQGFHGHNVPYHGYISIDPQNTTTIFKNGLEIKNKIGQIYIGPGVSKLSKENEHNWDHYVKIDSPSFKPRITIAFDIIEIDNKMHDEMLIPIL